MNNVANLPQRLAARLVRHASRSMPHTCSIWTDAMRSEIEHIKDQPGALAWSAGCMLASYKCRLAELHTRYALQLLRGTAACGLAAFLAGHAIESQASGQPLPKPVFTDTACELPHISPDIRPRLRCGTVSVPRDYERPEAGSYGLAVVVVRNGRQPAMSDPVVYISGGPGSPLTVHAYDQATHPLAPGRDVILVDQRGMGRSDPSICPNHNKDLVPAMVNFVMEPTGDAEARRRAAFMACRDEAIANGNDMKDFGTAVTAQDFDTVRRALGLKQWDVFGVSYGTTVAMTLMARYPETIRSAVLDSLDPPDPFLALESTRFADARAALFAVCDRDTACAAAYPHLGEIYQETLKQLDHSPPALHFPPVTGDAYSPMRLTASLFEFVIDQLVYFAHFYPGLPRLIASVHGGDTTLFARAMAALLTEATNPETGTNFSANVAVQCRDRPRFRQKLPDNANVLDRTTLYDVCPDWEKLGPPPVIPLGTSVPTLVLAGEFDPVVRPVVSREVADLIGERSRWVEFLLAGHSVRSSNPCAARIVAAFVDDPTQGLDTSCADQPAQIRFLPPGGAP